MTELPAKEKFKRPKLRNYETGEEGVGHQLDKPLLYKRNCRKATMLFSQGNNNNNNIVMIMVTIRCVNSALDFKILD